MAAADRWQTARTAIRLGDRCGAAADFRGAERAYRRALTLLKGDARRDRVRARAYTRALSGLGHVIERQGRYHDAARLLTRAVTRADADFGPRSLEVATALNNLGVCYKFLGRLLEAGPLYQRALAIIEARLGREHIQTATLYHNLGGLEHSAGNWMRGEPFARESVRIRTRALGPRHPTVAHDLTALAALLDPQRKFEESERLYRRAIAIFEREYGPDHPDLSVPLNNLGAVHQARGRPKQAEQLYRRALAIDRKHLGPHHSRLGFTTNNLAVLLNSRGRLDDAERLYRDALAAFRRALGSDHPNVGVCLENYADVLRALGRRRDAARCAERSRRILGRIEAVNDDGVAVTGTINPLFTKFRLSTRPSRINRLGVFADEPIPRQRRVIEYTGERVARREAKRRWNPKRSYLFELDDYWQKDGAIGGSGAELINHSCDPNLRSEIWGDHIWYISRRPIAKGEELTVDYRYPAELDPMPCTCGVAKCRGTMNLAPGMK
jgi:tetratricopeptide (TPR) repeat protein